MSQCIAVAHRFMDRPLGSYLQNEGNDKQITSSPRLVLASVALDERTHSG